MDPPIVVKAFKYNPSQQQPIFNTVLGQTPLHFRSFSKNRNPEESDDAEISIFDAQKYFCENNDTGIIRIQPQKKDPSLSSHDRQIHPRLSSVSSTEGRNLRTESFHPTPTASSEASSNSQTGLLVNRPGSIGVSLKNLHLDNNNNNNKEINKRKSSVAKRWILGRECCCTGQKSVGVKATVENKNDGKFNCIKSDFHKAKPLSSVSASFIDVHQGKITPQMPSSPENNFSTNDPPRHRRISASTGFSFPILQNPTQAVKPVQRGVTNSKSIISPLDAEDPRRDSLEVFQPVENPVNERRRFNPGSPIACVETTEDDMGSDASSDLFEIDSFSTQTSSHPMYRRRDSLDEAQTLNARKFAPPKGRKSLDEPPTPSTAATECYAPSEVSVDWSVTTAEGFDRASVSNFSVSASVIGGAAFSRLRVQEEAGGFGDGEGGKRKGNGGGLLLMSCRNEKAVSVGPQPVKCLPTSKAEGGAGSPVYGMHVGGRPPRPRENKTTTSGGDRSGRLSLAFAA